MTFQQDHKIGGAQNFDDQVSIQSAFRLHLSSHSGHLHLISAFHLLVAIECSAHYGLDRSRPGFLSFFRLFSFRGCTTELRQLVGVTLAQNSFVSGVSPPIRSLFLLSSLFFLSCCSLRSLPSICRFKTDKKKGRPFGIFRTFTFIQYRHSSVFRSSRFPSRSTHSPFRSVFRFARFSLASLVSPNSFLVRRFRLGFHLVSPPSWLLVLVLACVLSASSLTPTTFCFSKHSFLLLRARLRRFAAFRSFVSSLR